MHSGRVAPTSVKGLRSIWMLRAEGPLSIMISMRGSIDTEIAQFALEALNIDKYGLDEIDNKILCTIIDKFKGGPPPPPTGTPPSRRRRMEILPTFYFNQFR